MTRLLILAITFIFLLNPIACMNSQLPRNMSLKAFEPHRRDYECKHEAANVPPIDPDAEAWLQQGLAATSDELPEEKQNYALAAKLWQQAADRKHWKAMLNLASLYVNGQGVAQDAERAVLMVESAMRLGIPAAFDLMGTYHMEGMGVRQDASRAYAFWELAADMGSPSAQGYLGDQLMGGYDDPKGGSWANKPIGLKMLECAFAQRNGKAAYELGTWLSNIGIDDKPDYVRALFVLHEGVKFGSEKSAGYLAATFRAGDPMVKNIVDESRADRYSALAKAMRYNRDLKYPNLDKVLPLPPAQLPKWDGNEDTLVNAAKALLPAPIIKPTPGAKLSGRAHIPDGWVLAANPLPLPVEAPGAYRTPQAQYESTGVRFTGYWLAQLLDSQTERHTAWDSAQVPQRYALGESFEPQRQSLGPGAGRVMWHYLGLPVKQAASAESPEVTQGIARYTRIPEPPQRCLGNAECPHTGIWYGHIDPAHPQAKTYNRWSQQAYVEQGAAFPKPQDRHLDIKPAEVRWLWLGQANEATSPHYDTISLGEA